jgi:hypothetical protein
VRIGLGYCLGKDCVLLALIPLCLFSFRVQAMLPNILRFTDTSSLDYQKFGIDLGINLKNQQIELNNKRM